MKKPNRSENDILFACTKDILEDSPSPETIARINKFQKSWEVNKSVENDENFSHDNWISVYCWCKVNSPEQIKELPLMQYFNLSTHHARRPDNYLFFLYAKYPLIGWWFLWIPSMAMIVGAARVWRTGKTRYISTDGKILTFLKTETFNLRITRFIVDKIIEGHKDLLGWRKIFSIYHEVARPLVFKAFLKWEDRNK